jgi:hypothetical protein
MNSTTLQLGDLNITVEVDNAGRRSMTLVEPSTDESFYVSMSPAQAAALVALLGGS